MNLKLRIWMFLRRNTWKRSYDELHVEAAYSFPAFQKLCKYVQAHPKVNVMLACPLQDMWQRGRIQAENITLEQYEGVVADRYRLLKSIGGNLGVHVHLFGPYSVKVPTFEEQLHLITQAKEYFAGLGVATDDFAAGWNRYNSDTVRACEELGFKRFHVSQLKRGVEVSGKLVFPMVYNVAHDWELK